MDDVGGVIIIGGGLAGAACALELRKRLPKARIRIAEMADACLGGLRRMAPIRLPEPHPVDFDEETGVASIYRGKDFARHLFHRWDRAAFREVLAGWQPDAAGKVDPARGAEALDAAMAELGVECVPGRKANQVSPRGSDGLFRVWFDVGNPWEGDCLVLAMGGARHRGFGWMEEWGHRVRPGAPAFLALRLSESRWRSLTHVRWPEVTVTWQNPETEERISAEGELHWRYPFLEGSAVAAMTAQAGDTLRAGGTAGKLEIAIAGLRARGLDFASLEDQVRQGGSRAVAEDPQGDFHPAAWAAIVGGARIKPGETWARLSRRQLQTLAGHLARLTVKFSGSRQWRDEFSIQGGLDMDQFHTGTLESRCVPGLYVVGEMLDIDGAPGGTNLHLAWASAVTAAMGISEAFK